MCVFHDSRNATRKRENGMNTRKRKNSKPTLKHIYRGPCFCDKSNLMLKLFEIKIRFNMMAILDAIIDVN